VKIVSSIVYFSKEIGCIFNGYIIIICYTYVNWWQILLRSDTASICQCINIITSLLFSSSYYHYYSVCVLHEPLEKMTSSVRHAIYLAGKNPIGGAQKENSVAPNWNYSKPAALPDITTRKPRGRWSCVLGLNYGHVAMYRRQFI